MRLLARAPRDHAWPARARGLARDPLPPDGHGEISAGFEDALGTLTIVQDGAIVWSGSALLLSIVLWLTGPPLALWLLWLAQCRPHAEREAARARMAAAHAPDALPALPALVASAFGESDDRCGALRVERDRERA